MRRKQSSQMEQQADKVVLRRWRKGGDIIALFPEPPAALDGLVVSYQHVGQHGAADYHHVIGQTDSVSLARPDQERDQLLNEVRSIGYSPVVKQRRARGKR